MKHNNKILSGLLIFAILAGNIALAETSVYAGEINNKEKEEVVYIMTDADGTVSSVNVVNIFGAGEVTDYGDYSAVKMLTSTDSISQKEDAISFSTDDEKVYYQGTMNHAQIPWNILITYILDRKKVTPKEVAGQSGALEIKLSITENEKCNKSFFDDYALQVNFLLDTEHCSNIVTTGATMANVGNDKQISYTVLPGKGLETSIKSEVTDFEMNAVSINGIKLNLNVEIDDAQLMDKVTQIMDAASSLNDGATKLHDGTSKLRDAGNNLTEGTTTLYDAVDSLNGGVTTLSEGIVAMQNGLNALNEKSSSLTSGSHKMKEALGTIQSKLENVSISTEKLKQLTDSSSAIKQGITTLSDGAGNLQGNLSFDAYKAVMGSNGVSIDTLMAGNGNASASINDMIGEIQATIGQIESIPGYADDPGYSASLDTLNNQINNLNTISQLLAGDIASISGMEAYLNSLNEGAGGLASGLSELETNYEAFDVAITELANTLSGLAGNMSALKEGIDQMVESYAGLDTGIEQYTDGVATIVANYTKLVEGVNNLSAGSKKILDGTSILKDGSEKLNDGISSLSDGSTDMQEGTNQFYDKTSDMDTQVKNQIDDMIESISGEKTETVSFTSEKNTNVKSVQFVIKTDSIKKVCEAQQAEVAAPKKTFLQKLLGLFGL